MTQSPSFLAKTATIMDPFFAQSFPLLSVPCILASISGERTKTKRQGCLLKHEAVIRAAPAIASMVSSVISAGPSAR